MQAPHPSLTSGPQLLRALRKLAVPSLLALLSACATSGAAKTGVVRVATHDLSCDRVDIAEVSRDKYAAYGCGRGAVYTQLCDGAECRWGRLRHGHEGSIAAAAQPPVAEPREVLPAPAPAAREVLPAPAPAPRQVIPAPPPSADAPGAAASESPLQPGAAASTSAAPAPVALSDGELSAPYQTQVPVQQVAQQTTQAPPVPLVEIRPVAPSYNYVWINGYWSWGSSHWVWAPGYWCPPYYGYSYVPGSWYWRGGYWNYGPGGWARPGTTIIINRNLPPRPSDVATTRAFTPHRVVRSDNVSAPGTGRGNMTSHRVVAPGGSFQPRSSPMLAPVRTTRSDFDSNRGAASFGKSRFGADGVGRVVAPGSSARPRSDFSSSRGSFAPSSSYSGGGRDFGRPSAGSTRSGFDSGRSYGGGGGRSFSGGGGGGGGRSFGGGGGGGGFGGGGRGGGGMSPVRVSPGGGGRR